MTRLLSFAVVAAILNTALALHAEDSKSDPASQRDKRAEYSRLSNRVRTLFDSKKYAEAADVCRKLVALEPRDNSSQYNLACALAHLDKGEDALAALSKAVELGFNDAALMSEDSDLEPLRKEKRFAEILSMAKKKEEALVEKGKEMPDVKTLEGNPSKGLRYRLRMSPAATKEKPQRLLIWMHPSGGSMNAVVEALAPRFNKSGFALLVFTKKNFMFWGSEDAIRLPKTLDEVSKIEGISDVRPVLMGFSAGGQMALTLWKNAGPGLGGLVLDAAYPVQMGNDGQYSSMELSKDAETLKTPMFVLVGTNDGGTRVWKQCEQFWIKAGVPLSITYLEGRKHEWLFGKTELDALEKWLTENAAKFATPKVGETGWRPKLE
ncbi:MAG TPA: hypothetical protein VGP72_03935 [Planctomycetota bacterium]|jgi:dienelactone hydrolase